MVRVTQSQIDLLLLFSTNHQGVTFHRDWLQAVVEITQSTIPEDHASKHKTIHRAWRITL